MSNEGFIRQESEEEMYARMRDTLATLSDCGLSLTSEQFRAVAASNPEWSEVKEWRERNGLTDLSATNQLIELREDQPHVRITVDGQEKLMRVDPRDFGTIFVPESEQPETGSPTNRGPML